MKYKLTYRMVKRRNDPAKGTPGEAVPTFDVAIWTEQVDTPVVLQRMKALQEEHNTNIHNGFLRDLPQFIQFFPIEAVNA